MKSNNNMS